jgi:chaperonin GroEL (HSP60 family)
LTSAREQQICLPDSTLFGDKAFCDKALRLQFKQQKTLLLTPKKKPKGKELTSFEKEQNRLISKMRQPIESLFNWLIGSVEDAMNATRAAVEEGIVAGGGVALVRAAKVLDDFKTEAEDADEQIGVNIIRRALEEPLRQIAQNAGKEGAVIVGKVRESDDANYGFNASSEKFEDLVAAGVIDPAKVTRTALQNAASIAGLMLTTEAMIADAPDEKGGGDMHGGMGGGMGGMGMGM